MLNSGFEAMIGSALGSLNDRLRYIHLGARRQGRQTATEYVSRWQREGQSLLYKEPTILSKLMEKPKTFRKQLQKETDEWLEDSQKFYTCNFCGKPVVAGTKECHHCNKEINLKL